MIEDNRPTDEQIEEVVRLVLGPQHETLPPMTRKLRELELATIARAMWNPILQVAQQEVPS